VCVGATGYNEVQMAKGRATGGKKGGAPSAADLAERLELEAHWRPLMRKEPVSGQASLSRSPTCAAYYGEHRIVQGEAHFNVRKKARAAIIAARKAVVELWTLGAYKSDELDAILDPIIAAEYALGRAHPNAGQMADVAAMLADAEPTKTWADVQSRAIDLLAHHGVKGADDPYVVIGAQVTGLNKEARVKRGVAALKRQRQRRAKKLATQR